MIVQAISDLIGKIKVLSLQTYFPQSYKLLEDNNYIHKTIFGRKVKFLDTENEFYAKYIKNLKIEVFEIQDSNIDAFTIPGISSLSILKTDPIQYQMLGIQVLNKHPLSATLDEKTKQIIFNTDIKNFRILVFITSGLIKRIPNIEDRFAIICHEIGHWVYVKNYTSQSIFDNLLQISNQALIGGLGFNYLIKTEEIRLTLLIILIIRTVLLATVNIKNRQSEYDADRFVKEIGRASNLQNALSLLEYKKDFKNLDQSFFTNILTRVADILLMVTITQSHPPTLKRIDLLNESINIPDFLQLVNILNPLDKIIADNKGLLCNF